VYFFDFSFIQNSFPFMTSVTCDLYNVTIKILVANVTYNKKISRKDQLQNDQFLLLFASSSCHCLLSCNSPTIFATSILVFLTTPFQCQAWF
jgi:hypothetical protein